MDIEYTFQKPIKNEFTVDEVLELLKTDLLLTIKRCLMYEPNTATTWNRTKQAIDFELSRYSNFVDSYDITIDGTQYGDIMAQQSSSLEEYRLKYAAAFGKDPPDISEKEFAVRHSVTRLNEVYFNVDLVFVGGETASIGATIS